MIFRKNKAVDENGTYYTPQIRVYRGNEEITSSMLDVFFTVSSFEDYRVEYIVAIGEVQKVFTTKINVIDTQSPKIAVREELPASMNFENVFELPTEDF